jgi:DNA invertase Pin-like site-specific DNA recombinase
MGPRPKAYSYLRFSTPEQMQGDSFRRQTEAAKEYAERHGLVLDQELTFQDLGVSGFSGRNAKRGSLADFRLAVQTGVIASGAYLLVESFDRLSRMDPWDALPIFQEIINAGITIVTLQDGKVWDRQGVRNNPWRILESLIVMMRANEESATKSRRLTAVYENKRQIAAAQGPNGKPFTRRLPVWLTWNVDENRFELVPDRAELLRAIFNKAHQGWSRHRIAKWLNEEGIPTWGIDKRKAPHWHSSYIQKLLTSPSVVGVFTPHRKIEDENGVRRRKAQDPIERYFPAAVPREVFEDVSARFSATAARGRNAGAEPRSIFSGVLKCGRCGGTVTRVSKGQQVYLVCSRANMKAQGCKYQAVAYQAAEDALTVNAQAIFEDAPRGRETTDMEAEIEGLDIWFSELSDKARDLVSLYVSDRSEAIRQRLREIEQERDDTAEQLRKLKAHRDSLANPSVQRKLMVLKAALERRPLNVSETNAALKQAVSRIVIEPERATLTIHWHHSDETQALRFFSRHFRWDVSDFSAEERPDADTEEDLT